MSEQDRAGSDPQRCVDCNTYKPTSEFNRKTENNHSKSFCKDCENIRSRKYYIKKRTERASYFSKYRKTEAGKQNMANSNRRAFERYPEKNLARRKLIYAVKQGKIAKKPCENCGETKVQAHHYLGYDGEHWADVQWLCRKHHWDAHKFSLGSRGLV